MELAAASQSLVDHALAMMEANAHGNRMLVSRSPAARVDDAATGNAADSGIECRHDGERAFLSHGDREH